MNQSPFWFAEALATEDVRPQPPLQGEEAADVCIIGGGFTGLWTAIQCRQARPDWRIVLLEKAHCGSGASGRNGGCMLTWSTKYLSLVKLFGESEAQRLVAASEQAVFDIANFCLEHGIDADLRLGGAVYAASNRAQLGSLDGVLAALAKVGRNRWQPLDDAATRAASGSPAMQAGFITDAAGSLQPAKLVRGLLRVARAMGVTVYEQSAMTRIAEHGKVVVETARGRVLANQAVLALNADMPRQFPALGNTVLLVSSDMIITEPVPALMAQIGLDRGQAVCDLRTFVHYWRSTPDGRLMLGKGGNRIAFGNRLHDYFNAPSAYQGQLQRALARFFPALADIPVTQSWTGASDRSATGFPFFGQLPGHRRVFYGMGYSGNGVVQSYLGGHILASLLLERADEWHSCGLTRGPLQHFPPEPLRWCGAMMVRGAIRRLERAHDAARTPSRWDQRIAGFASMAGKTD